MPNQNKPNPQTSLTGYATQGAQMQQGRANGKQRELNADELLNMNPADLNKYITWLRKIKCLITFMDYPQSGN